MKRNGSRYWCYGLLLLLILFFALIRFRFRECALERDEGEYAYAGQLMLQGIPPYQLAYSMKLPGTAAAYAVILAVFGQTPSAIHVGLLLVNAAATLLVFLLGRRLFGELAGLVAAASYALLSTSPSVLGFAGHATHFVVLAALGGVLLLLRAIESKRNWLFFGSGFLFGLAFLMKQPGILFAIFGILYLAKSEYHDGRLDWRGLMPKAGALVLGTLLPFAVTCLVLVAAGGFQKFWFWTFAYSREYGAIIGLREGLHNFRLMFAQVVKPGFWIWAIAGVGLIGLFWNRKALAHRVLLVGLLFFSFLAVCAGLYFRSHYFILMLPAIALLAGVAVSDTWQSMHESRRSAWALVPVLVFLVAFAQGLFGQREYLFAPDPVLACQSVYEENPFAEAVVVGEYLKSHASLGARIAVFGSEPEIYFYAHRHSATGYIYTYSLMEEQPYALEMQKEMIAEVEAARPEFVIFVNVPESFGRLPGSKPQIFAWAGTYLPSHYERVGVVDMNDPSDYVWGDDAKTYRRQSLLFIDVLKRKENAD